MKTSLGVASSIVLCTAMSFVVVSCTAKNSTDSSDSTSVSSKDSAAIVRIHDADMRAVVAGDTAALMSLWTDDIVSISPDQGILRGRPANAAWLRAQMSAGRDFQPLEYKLNFEEVLIRGETAVEWGTFRSRAKSKLNGAEVVATGKLMRVLRREADGSWRVARTMFVVDATPGAAAQ